MIYIKLFVTAAFWGGTFIAGRLIAQSIGPYSISFLRFCLATFFLFWVVLRIEGAFPKFKTKHLFSIFLLGLTGVFLYNVFFFSGLRLIQAGRASLIIANNPVIIGLLSVIFLKEKLTALKGIGTLFSITGAVIVIARGDFSSLFQQGIGLGEILILGCVASWGAYTLIGKSVMKDLSPTLSVFYSSAIGTLLLFVPAWMEGFPEQFAKIGVTEWSALVYLSLCGTVVGFVWYYEGVREIGPSRASLFINFVPVCAVLMAHFILGEVLTWSVVIGAAFVILGVYLTNRPR
jgi:drug/metabolite transporter (DMT)-like permease